MTVQPSPHAANPHSGLTTAQRPAPDSLHGEWAVDSGHDTLADTLSGTLYPAAHETLAEELKLGNSLASACGMPAERQARMAARRAFVALKLSFMHVVEGFGDRPDLQSQVRQAEEPHDLWTLRASVFAALAGPNPQQRRHRQLLNRSLETMFPPAPRQLN